MDKLITLEILLAVTASAAALFSVLYFRLKSTSYDLERENFQLSLKLEQFDEVVEAKSAQEEQLREMQSQKEDYLSEISALRTQLSADQKSFTEKLALLEEAKEVLSKEFRLLSGQIFEQKQAQLTSQNKDALNDLLNPLQKSLNEFKDKVETSHKADLEGRASLVEQLKHLKELNQSMSLEAKNLTQALRGDKKMQGNWGEMILEKLLKASGLRDGIEYDREKSFTSDGGDRLRPDIIINLPENKHIVIDSKVSLLEYEAALTTEEPEVKKAALKGHLTNLQKHINTLAGKRYEHLEQLNAPDFILMFIPIEGAYLMAIEQDPSLFEGAFEKKVAVVTPTTLFTTLKTIEQLWRYERHSEHTMKLVAKAADVHDKFVGFVENFEKVGKQLNTAVGTYETARKQMIQGNGNLVRQAEMLKELAGKTKKEIPAHLIEEADGEKLLKD